ncbi:I10R1 protein, partial [Grantiella picta]|nr:I10R1 protein [Grantiella picta]
GEGLASPRAVRFEAEVALHLLRWEPWHGCPNNTRYDVEYKVYSPNAPWTAVPECGMISGHSCDLTRYTLDPERRYFARVRAVCGNGTSQWNRTSAFSPKDASPRLAGQSISVTGNSIRVWLQPLLHSGNPTEEFRELQEKMARYHVFVRRTQDNQTVAVVKNSTEFTINGLFWVTEYCLSAEISMANRPVLSKRSAEQCVTTGHRDRSAELLPTILSSSSITLALLGLLAALLVLTYVRKPVRTPSVLKSFMKQSSLWVEHEPPSWAGLDADPIQQLFLCQKEPQLDSSPGSSTSTAQLPLEKNWRLPAWPKDQLCLLGPTGSRDSSGTSTDSGICLHIPSSSSSSSLSCSVGPEPQGYRQQLPPGEDSGVGLESSCPAPGCSSGSENASPGQPGLSPAAGQEDVEFRGYLQQSKGTVEPEQGLGKAVPLLGCSGAVQGLGSTDTVLDMQCSELAVSKGYLRQSSAKHPLTQDLAPQPAPAWDFSSQVGLQAPALLSWGAPGAALTSKASPELLSIFNNTDFLGTLPLISSLSSDWITLPTKPLSLLSGDSKDSRL